MKNTFLLISLFIASIANAQSNQFDTYQLETKDTIVACSITAYVDNIELEAGYVEKISGSILTMRIAKNTDYLIQINNEKYFKIYGSDTNDLSKSPKIVMVNDPALIYRIQLGAFSQKIPNSYYANFQDLVTEKVAETNVTRLMTGKFNSLVDATSLKEKIHCNGFKDAFIVAYYEDERIEFSQALQIEAQKNNAENFELTLLNSNSMASNNMYSSLSE